MTLNEFAADLPREKWDTWDPMLISEGLFSAANIFSSLKLVYIFSVNPHLGPLQVSLSRMVTDIMKFFFLYVLVLFAFSSGLNQLLWQVSLICADFPLFHQPSLLPQRSINNFPSPGFTSPFVYPLVKINASDLWFRYISTLLFLVGIMLTWRRNAVRTRQQLFRR